MKKGVMRIITGSLLLALQTLSTIGSINSGNFYSPPPPASFAQLAYDIIFLATANWAGIVGTLLLISGLRAYFKGKKAGSTEAQAISSPFENTAHEAPPHPIQFEEAQDFAEDAPAQVLATGVAEDEKAVEANSDAQFRNQKEVSTPTPSSPKARFFQHYFIATTAIACAAVLFLLFALAAKNDQVAELTTRVSELEGELAVKDGTIQEYERSDTNLRIVISVHGSTIERLQKENDDMRAEIRFYENHVVLVPDDGSNEYHTYGCIWRKYYETTYEKTYRICTTEAAKSKGYKPCPHCCD